MAIPLLIVGGALLVGGVIARGFEREAQAKAEEEQIDAQKDINKADKRQADEDFQNMLEDFNRRARAVKGRQAAVIGKSGVSFSSGSVEALAGETQELIEEGRGRIEGKKEFSASRFDLIDDLLQTKRESVRAGHGAALAGDILSAGGQFLSLGMDLGVFGQGGPQFSTQGTSIQFGGVGGIGTNAAMAGATVNPLDPDPFFNFSPPRRIRPGQAADRGFGGGGSLLTLTPF